MDGVSYMQFIVPGLIMMSVITNRYGNIVSSFFGAKFERHLEEMLVAPMPNWMILVGYVVGGVVRGVLVGGDRHCRRAVLHRSARPASVITFTTVLLTAVVFSLGRLLNAIFAKKFDDIAIIPTFVLTPLTYLGGVFYLDPLLPPFWAEGRATRTRSSTWSMRSATACSARRTSRSAPPTR